jgi:hypothetical protein
MVKYTIQKVGGAAYEREFESDMVMREWVEVNLLDTHPHWYVDWQAKSDLVSVARVKNESWVPIPDLGATIVTHTSDSDVEDTARLWSMDQQPGGL